MGSSSRQASTRTPGSPEREVGTRRSKPVGVGVGVGVVETKGKCNVPPSNVKSGGSNYWRKHGASGRESVQQAPGVPAPLQAPPTVSSGLFHRSICSFGCHWIGSVNVLCTRQEDLGRNFQRLQLRYHLKFLTLATPFGNHRSHSASRRFQGCHRRSDGVRDRRVSICLKWPNSFCHYILRGHCQGLGVITGNSISSMNAPFDGW
ncbi:hypothetical protein VTI74DRAFT_4643 [Chaetomium olivicolor]